ncbi:hypothetical protein M2305_003287 [Gluconobacter cerinus]|uniref:phage tail tube protein n=1 Tax=Gluconobacter cerinus TaxID=38307 RepID=UPI001B8CD68C|nr:phage tail tube protein [Gluconobacter cerinus]MBS0984468.1 phage tail tube protein [Gluconobacter cerinus]MCW2267268.1 hypothetical protein [Gluconobacter cerinus]
MAIQTQGVEQFSMDGIQYNVVGNVTWNVGGHTGEPQISLQGVEMDVFSYTPVIARINVTVRWRAGVTPSTTAAGSVIDTIQFLTRSGIQVIGTNCTVTDVVTMDPVALTATYNFAVSDITEIVAS